MSEVIAFRKGNKRIKFDSLREASRKTKIPYITLYMRVKTLGWPLHKACQAKVRKYKKVA